MNTLLFVCLFGCLYNLVISISFQTKNSKSLWLLKIIPFLIALAQLALVLKEYGILNL